MRNALKNQKISGIEGYIDQLLVGHAASVMAGIPEGSIDLIVTSPPYWTAVGI